MQRQVTAELLDRDEGTPAEIAASLRDLRSINRRLGGISTTRLLLAQAMHAQGLHSASLLDAGSGDGYMIGVVAASLRRNGLSLRITLLDRAASHMAGAAYPAVVGDALALPFAAASFDFVTCNLLAHHLEPAELIEFIAGARAVCRVAVIVNDLRRHWLHLWLARIGGLVYRSRITRHDAVASVRRAYTIHEWRNMLRGFNVEITTHFLFRIGIVIWKQSDG
jgi:SAM-dependent methyltransferase